MSEITEVRKEGECNNGEELTTYASDDECFKPKDAKKRNLKKFESILEESTIARDKGVQIMTQSTYSIPITNEEKEKLVKSSSTPKKKRAVTERRIRAKKDSSESAPALTLDLLDTNNNNGNRELKSNGERVHLTKRPSTIAHADKLAENKNDSSRAPRILSARKEGNFSISTNQVRKLVSQKFSINHSNQSNNNLGNSFLNNNKFKNNNNNHVLHQVKEKNDILFDYWKAFSKMENYQCKNVIMNAFGWKVETPLHCPPSERALLSYSLLFPQFDSTVYISEFFEKDHSNYLGTDKLLGTIVSSIRKDKLSQTIYILIRSKKGEIKTEIPMNKKKGSSKNLLKEIALANGITLLNFKPITNPSIQDFLVKFEKASLFRKYKFGVLLINDGQTKDDEFFSNREGSERWELFLESIGKKVELANYTKYRGGLDCSGRNNTGEYSYVANYKNGENESGYEIMYHVSTLLPFFPDDLQQVERKRHLGNDVVNIIFNDASLPFDPSSIVTNFTHVYIIVKVEEIDPVKKRKTTFRVEVVYQDGVPEFGPPLPNPPVFTSANLRKWLLPKLINAERASFMAPAIRLKLNNTRKELLNEIAEEFGK